MSQGCSRVDVPFRRNLDRHGLPRTLSRMLHPLMRLVHCDRGIREMGNVMGNVKVFRSPRMGLRRQRFIGADNLRRFKMDVGMS